jgi:hypothetical protein
MPGYDLGERDARHLNDNQKNAGPESRAIDFTERPEIVDNKRQ